MRCTVLDDTLPRIIPLFALSRHEETALARQPRVFLATTLETMPLVAFLVCLPCDHASKD